MNDGRGPGAGSAPEQGPPHDPQRGQQQDEEQRVLEGRVIPAQAATPLPPQRRPGQSGHLPGERAGRPPAHPDPDAWAQLSKRAQQVQAQQSGDGPHAAQGPQPGPSPQPGQGQQPGQGRHAQQGPPPSAAGQQQPQSGRQQPTDPLPRWEPPRPEQQVPKRQAPLTPTFQPREERRQDEPDWAALADANDNRSRKRRLLLIGGSVLAAVAVAAAVVLLGAGDEGGRPKASSSASAGGKESAPEPTFSDVTPPPPPNPLEIISSAEKDTAPLTTDSLFPGKRFTLGDREYTEAVTGTTDNCASVALGGLAPVLTSNGCRQMLRATYIRDGVSITVGIAVFDTRKAADTVRRQTAGHIAPLSGGSVGTFCRPVSCWSSANAIGRYAYFTMAGFSNNTPVTSTDIKAKQSGRDVSTFAFRQITQRGKDAAGQ